MRKIIIAKVAKKDFSQIKSYVVGKFGAIHWNKIVAEWQELTNTLAINPEIGTQIEELEGTGYNNFKKFHHKNVFVVYSFTATELNIHMFIPSMRDFKTHLMNRLMSM